MLYVMTMCLQSAFEVDPRGRWPLAMVDLVGTLALQCTCEQASLRPSFVEIVTKLRKWHRGFKCDK